MKFKYYLRGLGLGVLFSSFVFMVASRTNPGGLSNEQIIERARKLGMTMEEGTLAEASSENVSKPQTVLDAQEKNKENQQDIEQGPEEEEKNTERQDGSEKKSDRNNKGNWRTHDSEGNLINASGGAVDPAAASGSAASPADGLTPEAPAEGDAAAFNPSDVAQGNPADSEKKKDNSSKKKKNKNSAVVEGSSSQPQETTISGSGNIPKQPDDPNIVRIEILKGEGCRLVAEDLQLQGVIADSEDFRKYMQAQGLDNQLHVGVFDIPRTATYDQIRDILFKPE